MNITPMQLQLALGCSTGRAMLFAPALNDAMARYEINTPPRMSAFLAQVGHESGRLVYTREIWGPTQAQAAYEGRADLGNVHPGDGSLFRGRGLIQITGRANYKTCGEALGINLEAHPELLEQPDAAALSAAWYWSKHDCNALADAGEFVAITRKINGGLIGQAQRVALWDQTKAALIQEA